LDLLTPILIAINVAIIIICENILHCNIVKISMK
jgi:hypothetical protein